jgi:hypothetical protein
MSARTVFRWAPCFLAAWAGPLPETVKPLKLNSDHAVAETGRPARIKGSAPPRERVEVAFGCQKAAATADANAISGADYLSVARRYADAMIENGRDIYGTVHSPLFAAALDRKTLRVPEGRPPSVPAIREVDRALYGSNPMHDLNLYQVLYGLTRVTGDKRYEREADAALQWFFENTRSPKTDLLPWGEHLSWSFMKEGVDTTGADFYDGHEFYRPWVLAERCRSLAPAAFEKYALAVWKHQILDHQTGAFSRHTSYLRHKPQTGAEFPRHGGFYIALWATAYRHSRNAEFLKAVEVLVDGFQRRCSPKSGAIPAESVTPELMWPESNLSLAIDLEEAARSVPPELARKLRAFASHIDETFLGIPHDLSPAGKGFVERAVTSTLQPGAARGADKGLFTRLWATGYGEATDAQMAMLCLLRYRQVRNEGYRKLFLGAAERYLHSAPDTSIALYPGALAEATAVMLGAFRLTGDERYVARAECFGQTAVDVFFQASPLPRASSRHEHYEAITRGDTLAMVLLDLWAARNKPGLDLELIWADR